MTEQMRHCRHAPAAAKDRIGAYNISVEVESTKGGREREREHRSGESAIGA